MSTAEQPAAAPSPSAREIIEAVAQDFGVSRDEILSERQRGDAVAARWAAMDLVRRMTPMSLPRIGRVFGRDHTTVLNAVRKMEERRQRDQALNARLFGIEARLRPWIAEDAR